eukprot:3097921-Heterocapsa_arctica.AAC.1
MAMVASTPIHMAALGPWLCLAQHLYRLEIAGHALGRSHIGGLRASGGRRIRLSRPRSHMRTPY